MDRPAIVHVSADFPDCLGANKTHAISSLIAATPEFDHFVYSINRVPTWNGIESVQYSDNGIAVAYGAPSKGLFLRSRMEALGDWVIDDIRLRGRRVDVIHAHKLTMEGIAGHRIADAMHVPFICSVQADTDIKIMRARPDLRACFRHIWNTADYVVPFSPRARTEMTASLGERSGSISLLPCITDQDEMLAAPPVANSHFVSIFHFSSYVRKNAKGLIQAIEIASREHPSIELDIFGTGTPEDLRAMRALLKSPAARERVHLRGPLPRETVQRQIQKYVAFVMPTRRESYGMVYAESLLAGVPILQSKGWGIHGLFADGDVGYSCDPGSIEDIKDGLLHLLKNEAALKRGIAKRQRAGEFNILRRDSIATEYRRIIASVASNGAAVDLTPPNKSTTATPSQHA